MSAGSFCNFGIPGQLSCGVDPDRLWFLEISSFSGGRISGLSCKMDTWPIWPPMGAYEKHLVHTIKHCVFSNLWSFLYRIGRLNITHLTKVLISKHVYVLYGNCSTTPAIAPWMLYVKSIGNRRYALSPVAAWVLAHFPCLTVLFWQFECVANLTSPELIQSLFSWHALTEWH